MEDISLFQRVMFHLPHRVVGPMVIKGEYNRAQRRLNVYDYNKDLEIGSASLFQKWNISEEEAIALYDTLTYNSTTGISDEPDPMLCVYCLIPTGRIGRGHCCRMTVCYACELEVISGNIKCCKKVYKKKRDMRIWGAVDLEYALRLPPRAKRTRVTPREAEARAELELVFPVQTP